MRKTNKPRTWLRGHTVPRSEHFYSWDHMRKTNKPRTWLQQHGHTVPRSEDVYCSTQRDSGKGGNLVLIAPKLWLFVKRSGGVSQWRLTVEWQMSVSPCSRAQGRRWPVQVGQCGKPGVSELPVPARYYRKCVATCGLYTLEKNK